ncbi:MAG: TonB-dependent receptor [Proteobacteria bacterium]|nr:TonB-dependent receptor [Pseudomonadota bacterium]
MKIARQHARPRRRVRLAILAAFAGAAFGNIALDVSAQPAPTNAPNARQFDISAQSLAGGLTQFGQQSGWQVSVGTDLIRGLSTSGVSGTMAPAEALQRLLAGTGLTYVLSDGTVILKKQSSTDTSSRDAVQLPTVVVTGQHVNNLPPVYAGGQVARGAGIGLLGNKDYMDTPFSIASYTEKTIRDQQAKSVAEVLTNTDPSVRAAIGSSNRYDALTIRGFRVENGDIAINGLYGLVPDFRVNPAPVERIELLKGPSAFLNGMTPSGSIGGGINLVTKRAAHDPLTRFTVEYLSNSVFSGLVDASRRYGDQKEYGVRFNGTFGGGNTSIDRQWVRNGSASLGLDYRGDKLRLFADVIYQNDWMQGASRGYTPVPGIQVPVAPDPRINLAQSFDYARSQSITGILRAEYDISADTMVFGAFGANSFDYDKREAPGATLLDYYGSASSTSTFQTGRSQAFTGQAGVRTRFETGPIIHEVAVSGSLLQQTSWLGQTTYNNYLTNIYAPALFAGLTPLSSYPQALASTNLLQSVAIADTLSAVDGKLQLIVGMRHQQIESSSFSPTSGATTANFVSGAVTPSVALLVKPMKELSFYGSYIQGLSPSTPPPAGAANPNAVFPPFRSTQYEVGAKLDLGRFGATLSAFQITLPSGVVDPVTKIFSIDGEQRNQGIEFSFFGEILSGLRTLGGVTFLDPRLTKTQGHQYDGNFAIGAPGIQANVGFEWDTPFVRGLTAIARTTYTSEAYVSADNTQKVPSWATLDVGLRYAMTIQNKSVVLRANVTNLLDSNYWIANPTGYVISGMPRTAWISLSTDF